MPGVRPTPFIPEMTVKKKRITGEVIFSCNATDCGASLRVVATSPATAWPIAKREGWVAWKRGAVFLHFCSWIHRGSYENAMRDRLLKEPQGVAKALELRRQ